MGKRKYIYVTSAVYAGGLSLEIHFSDGTVRTVDFTDFFMKHPHPMHNRFAEPRNFRKFALRDGNVVWGKNGAMEFHVEALYAGNLELGCDEVDF